MPTAIVVDRASCSALMMELSQDGTKLAGSLYARLAGAWGMRPDRERINLSISDDEQTLLMRLDLPNGILHHGVLRYGWLVTYRHPKKPNVEVVVFTTSKPPRRREFRVAGGVRRLEAVKARRIKPTKEAIALMARARAKSKKSVDEDELEELEALEDLEDLDDEEEEEEEPEDEEEEDEEEPAPKRRGGKAKKAAPKKRTRRKAAPEPEDEEEEEDEDEDDEEEDEEPTPKRKRTTKKTATKSTAKKSTAKKGTKRTPPAPRELPAGRLSPADVAELAGTDARYVRIYLRANEDEWPKPEGDFRYSFSKTEAKKLASQIKKQRAE